MIAALDGAADGAPLAFVPVFSFHDLVGLLMRQDAREILFLDLGVAMEGAHLLHCFCGDHSKKIIQFFFTRHPVRWIVGRSMTASDSRRRTCQCTALRLLKPNSAMMSAIVAAG